ncbi:metalloreductase protein [Rutstroemia sp. NJR-2017a BVV2]|nr:metalloreductase protein [Rutstroemia sp. NJR-2017a BVV2]
MDMSSSMTMGGAPTDGSALNASGIDFSNSTQAADFLGEILDDTVFQVDGNAAARHFWYGVCAVIALAGVANLLRRGKAVMRLRAAAARKARPAAPGNVITTALATTTAIAREATYPQFMPRGGLAGRVLKVPPMGTVMLLLGYWAWVILLEFVDNNVQGAQHFTSLGVRAAWLAVAQVPLLILLAGKNNLVGFVSGVSYERLNVIHRWSARVLFFLATLHVIFLHLSWNAYDLGPLEYSTDSCIPTGWAVYAILIWMNISTIAPIRDFSYEFFVVQHILTFFGFIIAVMMHLPDTALYSRTYIYIPIALYLLDRIIRSGRFAWNNARPASATLTALDGDVTRICVSSKAIKKWSPGSHVLLSIPKLGLGQSHPATIASTPTSHDGDLVFLLKSHKGFTSRLLKSASASSVSILPTKEGSIFSQSSSVEKTKYTALIDGPYGNTPDFATFDTVLLISGSTGTTFTLPILLDIASRAHGPRLPVRKVVFIWIIKNTSWTSWINREVTAAAGKLRAAGVELEIRIYVTCDSKFTTGENGDGNENILGRREVDCCTCDTSLGPCCCINIDDSESDDVIRPIDKNSSPATISEKATSSITVADPQSGSRSRILPYAVFHSGRPDFFPLIGEILEQAEGETGIAVCGPMSLNAGVRGTVARLSDMRAVHKGTGAQGVFLWGEGFGW